MRAMVLMPLILVACSEPPRQAVELAGALRRGTVPVAAMADQAPDCALADRACTTLWLARGAACAEAAEAPATPAARRPARRDCAIASYARALELTPQDATAAERAEAALRLAEALERRRDRATGAARRAEDAALMQAAAAIAALPGGGGPAAHYRAGVALDRVLSGDVPQDARCATLAAAGAQAATAADAPGFPVLGARIPRRRAAIAALLEACPR
jgi:hypothetical protein